MVGEGVGDLVDVSRLRKEDYDAHRGKSEYEDLSQGGNGPSSRTPRGHQVPSPSNWIAFGGP